jgi:hypothetical protein
MLSKDFVTAGVLTTLLLAVLFALPRENGFRGSSRPTATGCCCCCCCGNRVVPPRKALIEFPNFLEEEESKAELCVRRWVPVKSKPPPPVPPCRSFAPVLLGVLLFLPFDVGTSKDV